MKLLNMRRRSRRGETTSADKDDNNTSKSTFFGMRRETPTPDIVNDTSFTSLNQSLSFRVVSVPKEYVETNQSFNWMTNELDSFEYHDDKGGTVDANRKEAAKGHDDTKNPNNAHDKPSGERDQDTDTATFWLPPWLLACSCWSPLPVKDVATLSTAESSYDDGSGSTSHRENKEGEILKVKTGGDDVSDITETPSEDCSDSESEEEESLEEVKGKR